MLLRFPSAEIEAEVANTPGSRSRGLAGRGFLPENRGMLFDMGEQGLVYEARRATGAPRSQSFTMRGVSFPLDMIFIDEGGVVIGIVQMASPNTDGPYGIREPARWVLEASGGWADRHGVNIGDRVSFG